MLSILIPFLMLSPIESSFQYNYLTINLVKEVSVDCEVFVNGQKVKCGQQIKILYQEKIEVAVWYLSEFGLRCQYSEINLGEDDWDLELDLTVFIRKTVTYF